MWLRKLISPSNFEIVNSNRYTILRSLGVDSNFKSVKDGVFGAPVVQFREFGSNSEKKGSITRDWFAQIWNEESKKMKDEESKKMKDKKVPIKIRVFDDSNNGSLNPNTPIEGKLQQLLSRANLVIARDIEWANIMFAFEQENRYVIMDPYNPQSPAGYIREKSNVIFRQLLRSRRPFMAHITDSHGNEVFTVRRPFWWINSTIYAEVDGEEIGVVHKRWHLWKRIYDLYLGNKQFAVVENPGFWNWTFTLKDENENVLAQIDRNWRGIGFELFTDAGQYVIRFGDAGLTIGSFISSQLNSNIEELEVARPLTLSERAVTVALAMSLDNDYFSRRGGWGLPIMLVGE